MELHVLCCGVGGGVGDAGVPQNLVDKGVSVGHAGLVLQGRLATPDNVVNLLLDPLLDLWVPDEIVDGESDYGRRGLRPGSKQVHHRPLDISLAVSLVE